jgi:predicted small secreted protein
MKVLFNSMLSLMFLALITLSSCNTMCVQGTGEVVTRQIDLNVMKGIVQSSVVPVEIGFGMNQKVEITGHENLIALLETSVESDLWYIDFKENVCPDGMRIKVTLPVLEKISIEGSGNVTGVTPFQSPKLVLWIQGSGDLSLEVSSEDIEVEVDGSGDVKLSGRTNELSVEIDGSGDVDASTLNAKEVKIDIDGSGDVKTQVADALEVDLNGSGSVYYKGDPPAIKMNKNGSGEVVKD